MAAEDVFKRKRHKKRLMEESLRADQVALQKKKRERSMLKRINQGMVSKEEAKKKLADEYVVFFVAPKSNDIENTQKFDEKAMMNAISNTMNSDCSENGGFTGCYGDSNVPGTVLGLIEQAMMGAAEALLNSVATSGGDNGGFAGGHGGISNAAENANNRGKEGVISPIEGTSSDGGEGTNTGGYDGGNRRN